MIEFHTMRTTKIEIPAGTTAGTVYDKVGSCVRYEAKLVDPVVLRFEIEI
jgi:hypothetical protein